MLHMDRRMLSDEQWARIADLLPGTPTDKGGRAVETVGLSRRCCTWRGQVVPGGTYPRSWATNWRSVYVRFARWETYGVWHRVAEALQGEADLEALFIDATIVRAHQHAAGAPKKTVTIRRSVARAEA